MSNIAEILNLEPGDTCCVLLRSMPLIPTQQGPALNRMQGTYEGVYGDTVVIKVGDLRLALPLSDIFLGREDKVTTPKIRLL